MRASIAALAIIVCPQAALAGVYYYPGEPATLSETLAANDPAPVILVSPSPQDMSGNNRVVVLLILDDDPPGGARYGRAATVLSEFDCGGRRWKATRSWHYEVGPVGNVTPTTEGGESGWTGENGDGRATRLVDFVCQWPRSADGALVTDTTPQDSLDVAIAHWMANRFGWPVSAPR